MLYMNSRSAFVVVDKFAVEQRMFKSSEGKEGRTKQGVSRATHGLERVKCAIQYGKQMRNKTNSWNKFSVTTIIHAEYINHY